MVLRFDVWQSSMGWIAASATDAGLKRMSLPEPDRDDAEDKIFPAQLEGDHDPDWFKPIAGLIERYLHGESVDLSVIPIDFSDAPPFFAAAWDACRSIPAGETRSYSWLAAEAGRPGAPRAAGQAMARNLIPLLIPCHRVVRADGSLGGFGGGVGLPLKKRLLAMEGAAIGGSGLGGA